MTPLILSAFITFADTPTLGYYNETEISKASVLFAKSAEVAAPQFAKAESTIRQHADAIAKMEQNIALLNDDILRESFTETQRRMLGYRLQVSKHATILTDDYDKEFTAAMNRALAELSKEGSIEPCEAQAIHAMMGAAPKCEGESYSKAIAESMDADEILQSAIQAINNVPWPTIEISEQVASPKAISGVDNFIQLDVFVRTFMKQRILMHQQWLESQNDNLIEGIESGDKSALEKAQQNREEYFKRLSEDGTQLEALLKAYSEKRGKKHAVLTSLALCGTVQELGGCSGEDVTQDVLNIMKSDRYWAKLQAKHSL